MGSNSYLTLCISAAAAAAAAVAEWRPGHDAPQNGAIVTFAYVEYINSNIFPCTATEI